MLGLHEACLRNAKHLLIPQLDEHKSGECSADPCWRHLAVMCAFQKEGEGSVKMLCTECIISLLKLATSLCLSRFCMDQMLLQQKIKFNLLNKCLCA